MTVLIIIAIIFVLHPIAKAYADRLAKERSPDAVPATNELLRLREEVDRISAELARLQDEQSFMVRLLSDGERKRLGDAAQDGE